MQEPQLQPGQFSVRALLRITTLISIALGCALAAVKFPFAAFAAVLAVTALLSEMPPSFWKVFFWLMAIVALLLIQAVLLSVAAGILG